MNNKYTPRQDCNCHDYSKSECGHILDVKLPEAYDLRQQLAAERALADRLAGVFEFYFSEGDKIHIAGIKSRHATAEALAAWKEARNEI